MGPTVEANWNNYGAMDGQPWNLGNQPLSYDPTTGTYRTSPEFGAAKASLSFGFGRPYRQFFTKALGTPHPTHFGRYHSHRHQRSHRHRHHQRSQRRRSQRRRSQRRRTQRRRTQQRGRGTSSEQSLGQRLRDRLLGILGRKAPEYGYGRMAYGAVKVVNGY